MTTPNDHGGAARSACLVGASSLAIWVAEQWLESGQRLLGMVTDDPACVAWLERRGWPAWATVAEAMAAAAERPDWLFSVVNRHRLDATALAWPRRQPINYHDGPLPRHAGVNATGWAIWAGDREHGVRWHGMDEGFDTGPILAAADFAVPEGATTLSLNAQCLEAARATFLSLLPDLVRGESGPLPAAPPAPLAERHRTWDRLPGGGLLDWAQPAAVLARWVAAADHGPYANDFGLAKLRGADGTIWEVRHAVVQPATDGPAAPGQVLAAGLGELTVQAADGPLRLAGLRPLAPRPGNAPPWPRVGAILPPLAAAEAARWTAADRAAARREGHWRKRLHALVPLALPGLPPGALFAENTPDLVVDLEPAAGSAEAAWSRLTRLLAAWSGRAEFDVAWLDDEADDSGLWARCKPLRLRASLDPADWARQIGEPAFPLDLWRRFPDLAATELPWRALRVVLGAADRPSVATGAPLLITANPQGRLRLRLAGAWSRPDASSAWTQAWTTAWAALATGQEPLGTASSTAPPLLAPLEQVWATRPQAVAVEGELASLTYGELEHASRGLALQLWALGAGPGATVALWLPRAPGFLVGLVAVLRTGAAFVTLDPATPPEVLQTTLRDAGVVALVGSKSQPPPPFLPVPCRFLEHAGEPCGPLPAAAFPEHGETAAYVLYTSGSTGRPKGTLVGRTGLQHFLAVDLIALELRPTDRVLQLCALSFDAAIEEMLGALLAGATLVLRPEDLLDSPARFVAFCGQRRLTVIGVLAALLDDLVDHMDRHGPLPDCVRLATTGGEAVSPSAARRWPGCFARAGRAVPRLVNVYGLTETTIANLHAELSAGPGPDGPCPLGRPLPGNLVEIRDPEGNPVAEGQSGEIWMGGPQVALGYLNLPALTAERFPVDGAGRRWCRTGDLGRVEGGVFTFLGRRDDQLKRAGVRLDPEELAAVLRDHPRVHQVAVTVATTDQGAPRLLAWVAPVSPGLAEELHRLAEARLPRALQPARLEVLEQLPLTARGKVDTSALLAGRRPPSPPGTPAAAPTGVPGWLEELWWSHFPAADRRGAAGFFDLGGDSLLALQILLAVERRTGQALPLSTFFSAPSLPGLAMAVRAAGQKSPIVVHRRQGHQRPVVFLHTVGGDVNEYFDLAEALGPEVPCFSLRSPVWGAVERAPSTLEGLSGQLLPWLDQLSLPDDFVLAGYSWSGLLAWEVARQWGRRGRRLPEIWLIDAVAPSLEPTGGERARHFLRHSPAWLLDMLDRQPWVRRLTGRPAWTAHRGEDPSWMHDPLTQHLLALGEGYKLGSGPSPRLHLFRSDQRGLAHPLQADNPVSLPDLGWAAAGCAPASIWKGRVSHYAFMKAPHATELAAAMRCVLRAPSV